MSADTLDEEDLVVGYTKEAAAVKSRVEIIRSGTGLA